MGWIYIFVNLINFKVYIGKWSGKRVEKRRHQHKRGGGNRHLYRAIQKYGWDNFIFDTLHENVPKEMLNHLEMKEIARFDCNKCRGGWGYNETDGGDGLVGYIPSKETRQKMSDALKGKPLSVEHRQKLSKAKKGENHPNYGKSLPTETRSKISEGNKGKKPSLEVRQKLSEAHKGKPLSVEHRQKLTLTARRGENHHFYGVTGKNHPKWAYPHQRRGDRKYQRHAKVKTDSLNMRRQNGFSLLIWQICP